LNFKSGRLDTVRTFSGWYQDVRIAAIYYDKNAWGDPRFDVLRTDRVEMGGANPVPSSVRSQGGRSALIGQITDGLREPVSQSTQRGAVFR
jgi:hypothetical protein